MRSILAGALLAPVTTPSSSPVPAAQDSPHPHYTALAAAIVLVLVIIGLSWLRSKGRLPALPVAVPAPVLAAGPSFGGLAWYWWIVVVLTAAGLWYIIITGIRRTHTDWGTHHQAGSMEAKHGLRNEAKSD
jgi:hypothetical protein